MRFSDLAFSAGRGAEHWMGEVDWQVLTLRNPSYYQTPFFFDTNLQKQKDQKKIKGSRKCLQIRNSKQCQNNQFVQWISNWYS